MQAQQHVDKALRVERSMSKLAPGDHEMRIEAAMLAGTHWLNAALHRAGVLADECDVIHTYMLTVNEFRRLHVARPELMESLAQIEDARTLYVRGDAAGAGPVADRTGDLLAQLREGALQG